MTETTHTSDLPIDSAVSVRPKQIAPSDIVSQTQIGRGVRFILLIKIEITKAEFDADFNGEIMF